MLGSKLAPKIFLFCQSKEMLFTLGWDLFFGVYSVIQGYQHRGQKNWGSQKMA